MMLLQRGEAPGFTGKSSSNSKVDETGPANVQKLGLSELGKATTQEYGHHISRDKAAVT